MATDADIAEIFADDDSEAELEGFTEDDIRFMSDELPTIEIPDCDDDMDINSDVALGWSREPREPIVTPFTGSPGINVNIEDIDMTPYTFFKLFINDDDFASMSEETNRYHEQNFSGRNLSQFARMRSWYDTTPDEIQQWLGLVIITGLVDKPYLEKHWSTDSIIYTPIFSNTMPRDRFFNILSCYHLNNNDNYVARGNDGHDPVFKVRPLYDVTRARCLSVYTPSENLSLDEGMVPWKGRLIFKQFLPKKPDRFGMKMYVICEASSGYISHYEIYTGKDFDPNPSANDTEILAGHSYNVVMGFMKTCNFLNKGYTLYTDNYYSSPTLFSELCAEGTSAVGTARLNRKEMPKALKEMKLCKGHVIFRQRGELLALKWMDKRDVTMLSTKHSPTFTLSENYDRTTGEVIVIPTCIVDYNKYMGGVDRSDQLAKYYTITRKTMKWWKKLALHIINISITNAYILYKKYTTGNKLSHYDFRKELARDLISRYVSRMNRKGRRPTGAPENRLTQRHFPALIPAQENAKNKHPCRKCVVCNTNSGKRHAPGQSRKRIESRYWCPDCEKPLCVSECFKRYHTLKHYKLNADDDTDSSDN